jgi:hypothetical protein
MNTLPVHLPATQPFTRSLIPGFFLVGAVGALKHRFFAALKSKTLSSSSRVRIACLTRNFDGRLDRFDVHANVIHRKRIFWYYAYSTLLPPGSVV